MGNLADGCVLSFVAHLRENGHPGLQVNRWPDKENSDSPDIDAIAGPFAIEHTSIDTLPNQRLNDARFTQVINGLEAKHSGKLPFYLKIRFKYGVITTNQDWKAINQALENWIIKESPCLDEGEHVLNNITDVPFELIVKKDLSSPPTLVIYRDAPNDKTLSKRIKKQCDGKAKKLAKYQPLGKTTVLLIESRDPYLMNPSIMLEKICNAYPTGLPPGVDEIWYATSIENRITFKDFTSDLLISSSL